MSLTFPDLLGFVGVAMVLACYFWQQTIGVERTDWRHPAINAVGAVLLLYSLIYRPNPASIAIEGFWLLISIMGIVRAIRARRG
jgi:hypothetical protein